MKTSRRFAPAVNAGSMADIAFLLLIFFLVTAMIPNDLGIKRQLPPPCTPGQNCDNRDIHRRNVLEIKVNANNDILVENELIKIDALKDMTKAFLDNNADGTCNYCNGNNNQLSSDNPTKAVISLQNDKMTSYDFYIKVQDEITKAYFELRSTYAKQKFNKSPNELTKEDMKRVKDAYPFTLSEAELQN